MASPFLRRGPLAFSSGSRAFSTSSPVLKIGPESPKFIEVPRAKLPRPFPVGRPKGIIPDPKKLFPRNEPEKGTPEYLATTTPEPTTRPNPAKDAESRAFQEWKNAMAEKRRANLREGLLELKETKEKKDAQYAKERAERNARRQESLERAEREDVRLTLPSVLSTLRYEETVKEELDLEALLKKKQERVAQREQLKSDMRMKDVYELYLNAREFLITEEDLDKAIEAAFQDSEDSQISIALGPTVSSLLADKTREGGATPSNFESQVDKTGVTKVAGALTGGRLPPPVKIDTR